MPPRASSAWTSAARESVVARTSRSAQPPRRPTRSRDTVTRNLLLRRRLRRRPPPPPPPLLLDDGTATRCRPMDDDSADSEAVETSTPELKKPLLPVELVWYQPGPGRLAGGGVVLWRPTAPQPPATANGTWRRRDPAGENRTRLGGVGGQHAMKPTGLGPQLTTGQAAPHADARDSRPAGRTGRRPQTASPQGHREHEQSQKPQMASTSATVGDPQPQFAAPLHHESTVECPLADRRGHVRLGRVSLCPR